MEAPHINYIKVFYFFVTILLLVLQIWYKYAGCGLPIPLKSLLMYGKTIDQADQTTIPYNLTHVPKSWFKHFYFLGSLISSLSLLCMVFVLVFDYPIPDLLYVVMHHVGGAPRQNNVNATSALLAMALFTMQCYRRFYETHFVSVFATNCRMHIVHYLWGLIHYCCCVQLVIMMEAPKFAKPKLANFDPLTATEISATLLFLWAWWQQHKTMVLLANLRKGKTGSVNSHQHKLPNGGMFDYVSSPHNFTEILMYGALMIILWNNVTWVYMFVFVVVNQCIYASECHDWYKKTFKNLPRERKIIIPYIY